MQEISEHKHSNIKEQLKTIVENEQYDLEYYIEVLNPLSNQEVEQVIELGKEIAIESDYVALYLLEKSQILIKKIGYDGLEKLAQISKEIAQENVSIAINLIEKSNQILEKGSYRDLIRVGKLTKEIAKHNVRLGLNLLESSPEIIQKVGFQGFKKIVEFAKAKNKKRLDHSIIIKSEYKNSDFPKNLKLIYNQIANA